MTVKARKATRVVVHGEHQVLRIETPAPWIDELEQQREQGQQAEHRHRQVFEPGLHGIPGPVQDVDQLADHIALRGVRAFRVIHRQLLRTLHNYIGKDRTAENLGELAAAVFIESRGEPVDRQQERSSRHEPLHQEGARNHQLHRRVTDANRVGVDRADPLLGA